MISRSLALCTVISFCTIAARSAQAASPQDDLLLCQDVLASLAQEQRGAERSFRAFGRADRAFPVGQENPHVRERLATVVTRILRETRPKPPPWELRCRTWSCRLIVRETGGDGTSDWMAVFRDDPTVKDLSRGFSLQPATPIPSDQTGIFAYEHTLFIKLDPPKQTPLPEPTSLGECQNLRDKLRAEIAIMQTSAAHDQPRHQRFFEAQPHPALTAEISAETKRVLGADTQIRVECRGTVCRFLPPAKTPKDYAFTKLLDADATFRKRFSGGSCCLEGRYLELADADIEPGSNTIDQLVDSLNREFVLLKCYRLHSAVGHLEIRLRVPATGERNDDGLAGKISFRLGGSLAQTPLGQCVGRAISKRAENLPIPARISAALVYKRYEFPLRPADIKPLR